MKRLLVPVLALAATAAFSASAPAASAVSAMNTTLMATPTNARGDCPAVITFNGAITVSGRFDPTHPVPVQIGYQFLRSDNASGPISYYTITEPGTQTVGDTWTLGGPAMPTYSGWQQLKAWPTGHEGGFGYSFSPKANFTVTCAAAQPASLSATLSATPREYRGSCPGVITFDGTITVNGTFNSPSNWPDQVGYQFVRSDGAKGPISYFLVHGTGPITRTVSDTWTLGGPSVPNFRGWVQLNVWLTHGGASAASSPQAAFMLSCTR
jgi:hypothetical protein